MEEEQQNKSRSIELISENNIRSAQTSIQVQLEKLKITSGTTSLQTSYFCDKVKDHILDYDDEPHLSKSQNNYRRIYIASELFINICSTYSHIVDYEYGKIINSLVQWEKFKQLSRKINCKMQLELKREKFFSKEAQGKLLKSFDDVVVERVNEVSSQNEFLPEELARNENVSEIAQRYEREHSSGQQEPVAIVEESIPGLVINETLAGSDLEISFKDFPSNIIGNITTIREDPKRDSHHPEVPVSNISRHQLPLPSHQNLDPEISIGEPAIQQNSNDEIDQILNILEDFLPKEMAEIEKPEKILELPIKAPETAEELVTNNLTNTDANPPNASETSEDWSLPNMKEVEKTKKKHRHLVIDKATVIPSYAAKAMDLNKNIKIQRVQVFEGPPTLLREITAEHLMTTPGYKPVGLRNSKINTLYNRYLKVEKREVEDVIPQWRYKPIEERRVMEISKARMYGDFTEDVGGRVGMRSVFDKTDVLVEAGEKTIPHDLEITRIEPPQIENLLGIPLSRIINSKIEPPDEAQMERINAAPVMSTPRVQQLQGKTFEPKTSPPLFLCTKVTPPSVKYRKFNYILEKLQNCWSLFESQGMEKCITLNELLSYEANTTRADFLTLLRIIDKLSIQRKLLLKYKDGDLFIFPFETPYVSDTQMLFKERELVF